MRIKQLENRLTRKGLIYGDDIPLVYNIPVYISKFNGITFMTRKQAYKQSTSLSEYKFRSLEQFFKNAKIINPSGPLSYYNPKKGGVKQLGIQWGKRNYWKLRHLKTALSLIKNAEIGIDKTPGSWLVVQNDDYIAMIAGTNSDLDDYEEEMLKFHYENNLIPFEEVAMTQHQIRSFLEHLEGEEGCQFEGVKYRCGGKDFIYAKKILTQMNIPLKDQENFLEICKEFGGYCDCEILMNAAPILLDEDL